MKTIPNIELEEKRKRKKDKSKVLEVFKNESLDRLRPSCGKYCTGMIFPLFGRRRIL